LSLKRLGAKVKNSHSPRTQTAPFGSTVHHPFRFTRRKPIQQEICSKSRTTSPAHDPVRVLNNSPAKTGLVLKLSSSIKRRAEPGKRGNKKKKRERQRTNRGKNTKKREPRREAGDYTEGKEGEPEKKKNRKAEHEPNREKHRKRKERGKQAENNEKQRRKPDEKLRGRQGQVEAEEREGKIPSQLRQPQTTKENRREHRRSIKYQKHGNQPFAESQEKRRKKEKNVQ